jgi:hypothetical protein
MDSSYNADVIVVGGYGREPFRLADGRPRPQGHGF